MCWEYVKINIFNYIIIIINYKTHQRPKKEKKYGWDENSKNMNHWK